MKDTEPTRNRPEPGPSMADTLRREVQHAEQRLALAQRQLCDYLREHPEDEGKPSVYTTRGFTEHMLDGSGWRRL